MLVFGAWSKRFFAWGGSSSITCPHPKYSHPQEINGSQRNQIWCGRLVFEVDSNGYFSLQILSIQASQILIKNYVGVRICQAQTMTTGSFWPGKFFLKCPINLKTAHSLGRLNFSHYLCCPHPLQVLKHFVRLGLDAVGIPSSDVVGEGIPIKPMLHHPWAKAGDGCMPLWKA